MNILINVNQKCFQSHMFFVSIYTIIIDWIFGRYSTKKKSGGMIAEQVPHDTVTHSMNNYNMSINYCVHKFLF